MAAQGWISVHRQIQEHWLWEEKPFSKGQAWIDLLLLASHYDNKFLLGNELIDIKAGSFITSEKKLMERWGWGNTKVRNFLNLLEKDGMIKRETTTKRSGITIVNYSDFQISQSADKAPAKRKQSTRKAQANTINNDNNDNNENNVNKYSDFQPLNDAIIAFIDYRKKLKKPMTDRAIELFIKKLNELSPVVEEQIEIINQSIINGWQGIFPLKDKQKAQTKQKPQSEYDSFMAQLEAMRE